MKIGLGKDTSVRWLAILLVALSLFAATAAAVAADGGPEGTGPPLTSDGKGWCRSC